MCVMTYDRYFSLDQRAGVETYPILPGLLDLYPLFHVGLDGCQAKLLENPISNIPAGGFIPASGLCGCSTDLANPRLQHHHEQEVPVSMPYVEGKDVRHDIDN